MNAKDIWLANPNPSFWGGVPVGAPLCQRCYGIGHRARSRGKPPLWPGTTGYTSPTADVNDANADQQSPQPQPPVEEEKPGTVQPQASQIAVAAVLQATAETSHPVAVQQETLGDEEEVPQSSKRRRTKQEIETAEERRLCKSLPLHQLPYAVSGNRGVVQSRPRKQLRIDATPLLRVSTHTNRPRFFSA